MTLTEVLADWLTDGQLTRAREERDSAKRTVRLLSSQVGADISVADHIEVVQLLGAVLSRFRDSGTGFSCTARVGNQPVEHWRRRQRAIAERLRSDREDEWKAQQQRQGVTRG